MFDVGLLWRATDFWREGLKSRVRKNIKLYNTWQDGERALEKDSLEYESIDKARSTQSLPADFFADVAGWWWFVKEDGYLVSLSRGEDGTWSMHTRSGRELRPPAGFLDGLAKSTRLPPVMVGELVTGFTGCAAADRGDAGRRTVLRNEQFAVLHRVLERGDDPRAWVGLRVKVFAFPNHSRHVRATYESARDVMAETLDDHPHIGVCRAGQLRDTQDAIDIFARVVQLGLEGIVIVNPDVRYGTKHTEDRHDDQAGTCFKLKQKIVLPGVHFTKTGRSKDVWKDGAKQSEYLFTTTVDGSDVCFTDQQGRKTGLSRLKYMEYAPGLGDSFPCQSDYRHMHFATHEDMSVMVPAKAEQARDFRIENILGWDRSVDRIRSWEIAEDRPALQAGSAYLRLHNPRPFAMRDIVMDDDEAGAPPAPAKRRRNPTLAEWGRRSFARDFDEHTHPGARKDLDREEAQMRALLSKLAELM